jgi:Lrp/AsnC family leucine-responsive transcriptional regulator
MLELIADRPEIVIAWNITGADRWVLQIAVTDVAHLDAVVSQTCLLAETSASIILKTLRDHQVMLPPEKEPRS